MLIAGGKNKGWPKKKGLGKGGDAGKGEDNKSDRREGSEGGVCVWGGENTATATKKSGGRR